MPQHPADTSRLGFVDAGAYLARRVPEGLEPRTEQCAGGQARQGVVDRVSRDRARIVVGVGEAEPAGRVVTRVHHRADRVDGPRQLLGALADALVVRRGHDDGEDVGRQRTAQGVQTCLGLRQEPLDHGHAFGPRVRSSRPCGHGGAPCREPNVVELDLVEAELAGFDGQGQWVLPVRLVRRVHPVAGELCARIPCGPHLVFEGDDPRDRVQSALACPLERSHRVVGGVHGVELAGLLHVGRIANLARFVFGVEDQRVDRRGVGHREQGIEALRITGGPGGGAECPDHSWFEGDLECLLSVPVDRLWQPCVPLDLHRSRGDGRQPEAPGEVGRGGLPARGHRHAGQACAIRSGHDPAQGKRGNGGRRGRRRARRAGGPGRRCRRRRAVGGRAGGHRGRR